MDFKSVTKHFITMTVYLGADIGGTKVRVSAARVLESQLEIIETLSEPTTTSPDPNALSLQLIRLTERLMGDVGETVFSGYGISAFGPLVDGRSIYNPSNLTARGIIPIVDPLCDRFRIQRTVMANDANCGALAEYKFRTGENAGIRNLVYITLSTGIGGGFVNNGVLIEGKNGNAGEIGHMTVPVPPYFSQHELKPRQCGCGRISCLETYASGRAIQEIAADLLERRIARSGSLPRHWNDDRFRTGGNFDKTKITTSDVFEAGRNDDWLSQEVVDGAIGYIATAISNLINLFDPEAVFIGGGVSRQGDYLFGPLRDKLYALPALGKGVYVGPSQLGYDLGLVAPFALLLPDGRYSFSKTVQN